LSVAEEVIGESPIDPEEMGEAIEAKLAALQGRADPRVFEQAVDLLQLVGELYGAGLARVMELVDQHAPDLAVHIANDPLLASLLLANGLHPQDVHSRIAGALDSVRPFLAGHGGDVELLDIDERVGAVQLRLLGSCDGCPSSAVTLRSTVERAILDAAPEISIIDVEEPSDAGVSTPVLLGTKPSIAFDPTTGCGAAFESDVSVS
jgi:Fe-S cluster biogenesis protein NfuA